MQYVSRFIRLSACFLSLHVLAGAFAFTTSPQFGQYRTGASERLWFRFGHHSRRIVVISPRDPLVAVLCVT